MCHVSKIRLWSFAASLAQYLHPAYKLLSTSYYAPCLTNLPFYSSSFLSSRLLLSRALFCQTTMKEKLMYITWIIFFFGMEWKIMRVREKKGGKIERRSEGDVPTVKCLMNYDKWADIYIILWHPLFFFPFLMLFWDDCNDLILMVAHTSEEVPELYFNVLLCDTILCLHSNNIFLLLHIYSNHNCTYEYILEGDSHVQSAKLGKLNFQNFFKCAQPMHDIFIWLAKSVKMHLRSDPWCRPPK